MIPGRRVVIIGVASHWGAELARRLERDPSIEYLAGVDSAPPAVELERTDFIEADIRSAVLSRLLPGTGADTIVHCGILWYPEPGKPARVLHDVNVIGTLQLLAACQRTDTLRGWSSAGRRRSTAARGRRPPSSPRRWRARSRFEPASSATSPSSRPTSTTSPAATRTSSAARCATSPRSAPTSTPRWLATSASRWSRPSSASIPGSSSSTPTTRPGPWPRRRGAPVRGAVNVAPSGSISLSHILRLARRASLPIPHPLFGPALARLGSRLGAGPLYGDGVRFLRFGRGVDNRRLRTEIGYQPSYDAEAAVRDFATKLRRAAGRPPAAPRRSARRAGRGDPVSARARRAEPGPDGASVLPTAEALADFLRRMRIGIDDGLDPMSAAQHAAGELPKTLRDVVERVASRLGGEYHEDEWGFDEEFAEAVYPAVRVPVRGLVEGGGRGSSQRARPRPGAAGLQPRRLACSPSTPR